MGTAILSIHAAGAKPPRYQAWSPGWVGSVQLRPYHLVNADRFYFRGEDPLPAQSDGAKGVLIWTITWERLK